MARPAKLVGPRRETDSQRSELVVEAIGLPPAVVRFTRTDAGCVGVAAALHLGLFVALAGPVDRLGVGGMDPDAIGVEIITDATLRDALGGRRGVGVTHQGNAAALASVNPQRSSQPVEQATAEEAELAMPNLLPEPTPPQTATSNIAVTQSLAANANELETMEQLGRAAASARAGQRHAYKLAIHRVIETNPPHGVEGQSGVVQVEFRVLPSGLVTDVRVLRSSGSHAIDESAVTAVAALKVPQPPELLTGSDLLYDIEFTF